MEPDAALASAELCPECGESLLRLEKPSGNGGATLAPSGFDQLPAEAFDRMCLDPALAAVRRRFFFGVATVVLLCALAIVRHVMEPIPPPATPKPTAAAPSLVEVTVKPAPKVSTAGLKPRTDAGPRTSSTTGHVRSVFAGDDSDVFAPTAAQPPAVPPSQLEPMGVSSPALDPAEQAFTPASRDSGMRPVFEVATQPGVVAPDP